MVTLSIEFVKTKYPGYFWNTESQTLYSLKVDGVLKEIKITNPNPFSRITEPGYRVSVKGKRRFMSLSSLKKHNDENLSFSVYPVKGRYGR